VAIAQAVQNMFQDVGVHVKLQTTESSVIYSDYFDGSWPGLNTGYWPATRDPDGLMVWDFQSSASWLAFKPFDVLANLTMQGEQTYDPAKRQQIYLQLNRTAWPLCPYLYVQVQDKIWAHDSSISWDLYQTLDQQTETWYYNRAPIATKFFGH
jgi:ABC-type transport system substrate-binding protein